MRSREFNTKISFTIRRSDGFGYLTFSSELCVTPGMRLGSFRSTRGAHGSSLPRRSRITFNSTDNAVPETLALTGNPLEERTR
jgi:hypothetical protein